MYPDPMKGFQSINTELANYSKSLIEKPQILVLNKLDVPGAQKSADTFQAAAKDQKVILISAITGKGLDALISKITELLDRSYESG